MSNLNEGPRGAEYHLGSLQAYQEAMKIRVDGVERWMAEISSKLDHVLLQLATDNGSRARAKAMAKTTAGIIAAIASIAGVVTGFVHFVVTGVRG